LSPLHRFGIVILIMLYELREAKKGK